jgi:hypothetical protein
MWIISLNRHQLITLCLQVQVYYPFSIDTQLSCLATPFVTFQVFVWFYMGVYGLFRLRFPLYDLYNQTLAINVNHRSATVTNWVLNLGLLHTITLCSQCKA